MKNIYSLIAALFIVTNILAQSPEKLSYQAVVRDSQNELVANFGVGMQISILQDSANGTAVYVETQIPATNANGLMSIEIGGGTQTPTRKILATDIEPNRTSTAC